MRQHILFVFAFLLLHWGLMATCCRVHKAVARGENPTCCTSISVDELAVSNGY